MNEKTTYGTQFWICATGFCLLWVLLPTFLQPAYRPDVVELQIICKEWVLSTAKHPMLPAWVLEIVNLATNNSFAAPFIAAQLCVLLTLWGVWSFAKTALAPKLALLGTLAIFPYWFFTVESIKFNQNIALLGFWTLAISRLFQAIQKNRLRDWIIVGIALGVAFHAKYSTVFLVVTILLYMTTCSLPRQRWKGIGPYLTTAIAFLIFLPQLIWLYQHDFICFRYAGAGLEMKKGAQLLDFIRCPLFFLTNQIFYIALPVLVLTPLLGRKWKTQKTESHIQKEARKYLAFMIGVPLGLHLLICLAGRAQLTSDYGAVFWPFFGIFLLLSFQTTMTPQTEKRSFRFFVFAELAMVALMLFQSVLSPYVTGTARRFHFPMQALGVAAGQIWSEHSTQPCPFTTGDWWIAGNAAVAMKDRPRVLFYWHGIENRNASPTGLWANDTDVNESRGGLVFWEISKETTDVSEEVPDYVRWRFPNAVVRPEPIILPYTTSAKIPPVHIGVAIIPSSEP
ncbi:MAG: glycosyltransferase family 39 protein [Planctomycetaceae bacterium]|nr:glycosyltransferase family 39 protein [Planctomycetaceae bacterium]